jgi:hypothetical protein
MCKSGNLTPQVDSGCENESGNLTPWWTQGLRDVLVDTTIIITYCILGNPQPKLIGSPDPLEICHLKLIGVDHGLHGVQNDGLARLLGLVKGHDCVQGCLWM